MAEDAVFIVTRDTHHYGGFGRAPEWSVFCGVARDEEQAKDVLRRYKNNRIAKDESYGGIVVRHSESENYMVKWPDHKTTYHYFHITKCRCGFVKGD